jgi:hypothetical protein
MPNRRLPVIQEPTGADAEAAARPAWHWSLIGSGFLVTLFLPLALVTLALARTDLAARWGSAGGAAGVAAAVSFALAALISGYLVARFGSLTGRRHVAFAGILGAVELWGLVLLGGGFAAPLEAATALFMLSALGAAFCVLGAWLHRRRKSGS